MFCVLCVLWLMHVVSSFQLCFLAGFNGHHTSRSSRVERVMLHPSATENSYFWGIRVKMRPFHASISVPCLGLFFDVDNPLKMTLSQDARRVKKARTQNGLEGHTIKGQTSPMKHHHC